MPRCTALPSPCHLNLGYLVAAAGIRAVQTAVCLVTYHQSVARRRGSVDGKPTGRCELRTGNTPPYSSHGPRVFNPICTQRAQTTTSRVHTFDNGAVLGGASLSRTNHCGGYPRRSLWSRHSHRRHLCRHSQRRQTGVFKSVLTP